MDNLKLSNRIAPLFAQQHARHAMYMAGSAVVSCYLGAPLPRAPRGASSWAGLALSHAPFAPTIEAVSNYFGGALTYLGSVGLGVADWVEAAGGEIGQRSRDVLSAMGHFFGDRVDSAKSYFDMAIANTAEFAALWRGTIKESILGDPQALLDRACNVVTRIGEVFAVVAGIKESYSWVCRKFLGRRPSRRMPSRPRSPTCTSTFP